jgi:hypothetical protein
MISHWSLGSWLLIASRNAAQNVAPNASFSQKTQIEETALL